MNQLNEGQEEGQLLSSNNLSRDEEAQEEIKD